MLTRIGNKVTVGRPLCNVLRIGRPLEGGGSFLRDWTVYGRSEVVGSQVLGVGDIVDQLIKVSDIRETRSANGLTFTNNGDGTFTINGTATADGTLGGTSPIVTTIGHKILSSASNRVYTASEANDQSVVSYHTGDVFNNKLYKPLLLDLTGTPWEDVTSVDEFAQRLGYADASKLPQFAYGKSAVLPIVASNRNLFDPNAEHVDVPYGTGQTRKGIKIADASGTYYGMATLKQGQSAASDYIYLGAINWSTNTYRLIGRILIAGTITSVRGALNAGESLYLIDASQNSDFAALSRYDFCVNISDAFDGTYTPHQSQRFPLVISSPLHGIGDVRDIMRYSDHGITRKYGVVDLGTLSWTKRSYGTKARFETVIGEKAGGMTNCVVPIFTYNANVVNNPNNANINEWAAHPSNNLFYILVDGATYADAAAFKAAMSGVLIVYELATPTFEPVTLPKLPAYRDGTVLYTDTQVHGDTIAGEAPVGFSLLPPVTMTPPTGDGDTNGQTDDTATE